LGQAAAEDLAEILRRDVAERGATSVILATGNSQLAFMRALSTLPGIPWGKVTVFNMDSYVGMPAGHPASFTRYIRERLTDIVHPLVYYDVQGYAQDIDAEVERYTRLLERHRPVACVLGIGENGHLAFNDPPAALYTHQQVHVVELTRECRMQQVGEGHFASIDDVPPHAITLTIPALLNRPHVLAVVPEARKSQAVRMAIQGPISPDWPASVLTALAHARLYLDVDSAALLESDGWPA
jgi:glucosamine-6-phosphate deaminase